MPRHATAAGSAIGGFIEGVTGGFKDTTEFRRQRRFEQQVAEQISAQTARQGRQDARQVGLDEEAAADRLRAQRLADIKFFLETGIDPTPATAPDVGTQGLPRQAVPPAAPTQPPGADPAGDPTAEGIVRAPPAGTPMSMLSAPQ